MRRKRRGGHKPDGTLGFGLRSQHGGEDELVGEAATVASALWGWIGLRLEGMREKKGIVAKRIKKIRKKSQGIVYLKNKL